MDPVLWLALIAAGAVEGGIWWGATHRTMFVVKLIDGTANARGKVPPAFLAEIGDAARRHGLVSGTIRGLKRDGRTVLTFSRDFPADSQQQLRNVWTARR